MINVSTELCPFVKVSTECKVSFFISVDFCTPQARPLDQSLKIIASCINIAFVLILLEL